MIGGEPVLTPQTQSLRLFDLMHEIEQGSIKLPDFQREYVWRERHILELLDSLVKGYPIGTILLWEVRKPTLRDMRNLGGFALPEARVDYPIRFVLDGQQRLTTIFAMLKQSRIQVGAREVTVYFDLLREEFIADTDEVGDQLLPLDVLADNQASLRFLQDRQQHAQYNRLIDAFSRLQATVQKYEVPTVVIREAEVRDVAHIFERINNTGLKLRLFDLMVALTYSPTFYLRQHIRELSANLDTANFGDLDEGAFLQIMSAVRSGGNTSRDDILQLEGDGADLQPLVSQVGAAAEKTVDLFRNELFIFADDFLPYERQFVAIAYLFTQQPELDREQRLVVRSWFLSTSFSERYRRGGEGVFAEDVRALLASVTDKRLHDRFNIALDDASFRNTEFRRGSALTHAFVCLLASHRPHSIWNAAVIDIAEALSSFNRREFHHLFPKAYLTDLERYSNSQINALANFCMLPAGHNKEIGRRAPSAYMRTIQDRLGAGFEEVMRENMISRGACEALMSDNYEAFLEIRSADIAGAAREAVAR